MRDVTGLSNDEGCVVVPSRDAPSPGTEKNGSFNGSAAPSPAGDPRRYGPDPRAVGCRFVTLAPSHASARSADDGG